MSTPSRPSSAAASGPGIELGIVAEQEAAAPSEIARQQVRLVGGIGAPRPEVGDRRAVVGHACERGERDLAHVIALLLERQIQPVEPIGCGHQPVLGAVALMGVEGLLMRVVRRRRARAAGELAVAGDEADDRRLLAQRPQRRERDLGEVGRALDLDRAAFGLDHGRVVGADLVAAGELRAPVELDRIEMEQRRAVRQDLEQALGFERIAIGRVVEVGDGHRLP